MDNLFHTFHIIAFSVLALFSSQLHTSDVRQIAPTPTQSVYKQDKLITANGSISKFGQTITITLTFPKDGGEVQGNVDGACAGKIVGNYTGGTEGILTGTTQATCTVFYIQRSGNATFTSNIDLTKDVAEITAHVSSDGIQQDISLPLDLSQ